MYPIFSFILVLWGGMLCASGGVQATEDPILLSREIINGYPEHWGSGASSKIIKDFSLNAGLSSTESYYSLLESPGLTLDYYSSEDGQPAKFIAKSTLLEILKKAAESPEAASRIIAMATLQQSLNEYSEAYSIAGNFLKTDVLSLEEAIAFLDNRYGYAKLEDALALYRATEKEVTTVTENKKVRDKLRSIDKTYPSNISMEQALNEVYGFYSLLEQEKAGLAAYGPYIQFKETMEQLNKSRLAQRRKYRSTIAITEPGGGEVWELNEPVSLRWTTTNIAEDKTLRFFLVKGEMVVQELGTFKNTGSASGMRLNKNIDSGEDYKVVAIELFPANKYYVAKVASPSFSIRRPVRRKEAPVAKAENPVTPVSPPVAAMAINTAVPDSLRYERMSFEGRKISYVQELTVDATDIRISIWDHGKQDRDIVSIYLNGEPVVSKHYLTYHKKHFDVHLDPSKKNDLFLYAHNLGFYPPNTVSIEVIDNTTSENIVLNSDLKSCEAVLINVRP